MNNPYKVSATLLSEIGNLSRNKVTDTLHSVTLYGKSVRKEIDESACTVFQLENETGTGKISIYQVFSEIEHIFSELYFVREQRKSGYMKIKILEMLLFLSDLDTRQEVIQTEYYSQKQVSLIKEIADFITEDITKHYTIEQLAEKYHISPTSLKKCFRGVYGSSVCAYLRMYRLQTAGRLLAETTLQITEIAAKTGYDNPNKLSSAFKQVYGVSPTDFRRGVRLGSDWSK